MGIRLTGGLTLSAALIVPATAWGQQPPPPASDPAWSVTVHVGGMFGREPGGGDAFAGFPVGETLTTAAGFPTRVNPSWFFGDGSQLFNEVQSQFAVLFDEHFARIQPLDDLLRSANVRRRGRGVGLRIGRRLTPRVGIEFEVDRGMGSLRTARSVDEAVEGARAGFEQAISGLLATVPASQLFVRATAERLDADAGRTAVGASMTFVLSRTNRLETYASAGAAWLLSGESASEVRLRGTYEFRIFGSLPVEETDAIAIRFTDRDRVVAGLVGGGVLFRLSRMHALRAEGRLVLSGSGMTTSVEANPSRDAAASGVALPSQTDPSIQFSSLTTVPSSLGGGRRTLTTFTASGVEVGVHVTAGIVFRF
jgi:hypothetical protein